MSYPRPGPLWKCTTRIAIYPIKQNESPPIQGIESGIVILTLEPGSKAGIYGPSSYYKVLYEERIWEINSSYFGNGTVILCQ